MSVVCCLSSGWLLDHLSFINKSVYPLCHSYDHSAWTFVDYSPTAAASDAAVVAATLGTKNSCRKDSVYKRKAMGEKASLIAKEIYVFREDFFNVLKPHITAKFQMELQQKSCEVGLGNGGSEQQERVKTGDSYCTAKAKKKRKRSSELNHGERDALEYHLKISGLISDGTRSLVQEGLRSGFLQSSTTKQIRSKTAVIGHSDCGLAELCEMAKQFPSVNEREQSVVCVINEESPVPQQVRVSCVTENTTNYAKMITLMGQKYLFPPKSAFLLSDISFIQPLLDYKKKFGIIVIDPPWENKSVKRSNRYSYLSHWQIKKIPVPALAAPDCLLVTWVTNRQKHLCFVKNELYPHWSVHGVAEWFWVKITRSGEFVFPLNSFHKKPYEVLVLGRVQGETDVPLRISESEVPPIPDQKLIVSVPCTLHSHKPPLTEILKGYAKPDVECLELFARNLQPGWTCWGNEVLKFQHMDYFTALPNKSDK
ncbi:N(6)-adenine-specific methyltransferase METTL4 isoform X2 [Rhineura floridana]|uniref:N(6)-adenine-specific methyltransferase METTL4 isoform X2 n=1 Tax=Rhineura floridana TaxID=261503 RepID=UPI002AC80BBF|nr:N(6)-adenine-specific methyltransferase METTL4 isoform X2 [Rhineura floridana]